MADMQSQPRTLVLGATGRIGRVLRRCWSPGQATWQGRRAGSGPGWSFCDPLTEPAALAAAARGCGAILNLAGVTDARVAAGGDLGDNLALARAAIRAAAGTGARVLLVSSAAVYGRRVGVLDEDTPPAPLSDYGRAKAAMETEGAELGARLGVPVTSLRIGNVAGLDAALGGWRPGFELDRFSDGTTPARSYIGPATLARVLHGLCTTPALPGVLNVAAPGLIEMGALLDAAGLGWAPRPAPPEALARVHLATGALERHVRIPPAASDPGIMVAEWRVLEPHVTEGADPA